MGKPWKPGQEGGLSIGHQIHAGFNAGYPTSGILFRAMNFSDNAFNSVLNFS